MGQAATTKLSSRGQVVIPEEIRSRLGLEAGVRFIVVGEGDVVVLKALKPPKVRDFKALLAKARKSAEDAGLTPADVDRAIREVRGKK
jgi:AbrB family looped-hinge helix DNA binding protein